MTGFLAPLTCMLVALLVPPQSPAAQSAPLRPELVGLLDFEADHIGGVPKGWGGGPPGTFAVDDQVVHGGRWSLRIERKADAPDQFTAVTRMLPIDFAGGRLELSGFLRTENVAGFAGLWMRQDGDSGVVAFDNMQSRRLNGTTGWTEYTIALPLAPGAKRLFFGVLAAGGGRVWADDLRLLVDGKPFAGVPRIEPERTAVDLDKEFDAGSGIVLKDLTKTQIANLAMLGKVWGFLKYHHPADRGGETTLGLRPLPRAPTRAECARRGGRAVDGAGLGDQSWSRARVQPLRQPRRRRTAPEAAGDLADRRRARVRPRRIAAGDSPAIGRPASASSMSR